MEHVIQKKKNDNKLFCEPIFEKLLSLKLKIDNLKDMNEGDSLLINELRNAANTELIKLRAFIENH